MHQQQSFLNGREVEAATKVSPSKRRQLIKAGKFPCGLLVGLRTRLWLSSEIDTWISEQIRAAQQNGDLEARAKLAGARMVEARRARRAQAENAQHQGEAIAA